ncbi:hypothetical protein L226DRAFT_544110 [Lentinus tigrinus ALCF2SS1-7]|uniref:uncharacterized protein n=1 Tax=Lentinus tigrinus ALCF2SS1-7 TaxID=1328758 RepID=UPI0011661E50|nr:hypothetical protein L226DRAFT_544110 [Lentinus tigrinus ALCF2SS1-7]
MDIRRPPGPHDVSTTLNYYTPLGDPSEEAYRYIYLTPPPGKPEHNLGDDPRPVVVHDARGREHEFSLDKNGFQFMRHASAETEFVDEERIKTVYYKEAEELLKSVTGAKRVLVFDHTIRCVSGAWERGNMHGRYYRMLTERVHIDQTYEATIKRVHQLLGPSDAPRLLQTRVRLINVWRPIAHPVFHRPLALADWRTLDEARDLVPVTYRYPDRTGATFSVRWNPAHAWWYLSEQRPDEVALIKCYDSLTDRARLTPHSAFWDAGTPEGRPSRQSIELRALVFDEE